MGLFTPRPRLSPQPSGSSSASSRSSTWARPTPWHPRGRPCTGRDQGSTCSSSSLSLLREVWVLVPGGERRKGLPDFLERRSSHLMKLKFLLAVELNFTESVHQACTQIYPRKSHRRSGNSTELNSLSRNSVHSNISWEFNRTQTHSSRTSPF